MSETETRPAPGFETAARSEKPELRLWLRLLTCTVTIENDIRRRLRERFDVTLPRFDMMAQLAREPEGMTMGELSRRLMVSNGNVTGLTDRLAQEGLVVRTTLASDRRTQIVALTPRGRVAFEEMAREHEAWVERLFADLDRTEISQLMRLLEHAKQSARNAQAKEGRTR